MEEKNKERVVMSAGGNGSERSARFKEFMSEFSDGAVIVAFIFRRWKECLLVLTLILCYIGNRYNCEQKLRELTRLRSQAVELRAKATTLSSELMGKSRPSQIEELFEEKGIDIRTAKTPSYTLKRVDYED